MKNKLLFVINDLHRSPEAAALLERLYLIDRESFDVSVYLSDKMYFLCHEKKIRKMVPDGIKLIKKVDGKLQYDSAGFFSDSRSARAAAACVLAGKKHLYLYGNTIFMKNKESFYSGFDQVYAADLGVKASFLRTFPLMAKKTFIMGTDIRIHYLERLAYRRPAWADDGSGRKRIVSGGYMSKHGHWDIALIAAGILKERGVDFKWYITEVFPEERARRGNAFLSAAERMRLLILVRMMGLKDRVFVISNPAHCYEYIGQCDVYAAAGHEHDRDNVTDIALMLGRDVVAVDSPAYIRQLEWEEGTFLSSGDPYEYAELLFGALSMRR